MDAAETNEVNSLNTTFLGEDEGTAATFSIAMLTTADPILQQYNTGANTTLSNEMNVLQTQVANAVNRVLGERLNNNDYIFGLVGSNRATSTFQLYGFRSALSAGRYGRYGSNYQKYFKPFEIYVPDIGNALRSKYGAGF